MEEQGVVVASDIDIWDSFEYETDTSKQRDDISRGESFSSGIRKMMQRPVADDRLPVESKLSSEVLPQYESIFELAKKEDLTVAEFVRRDPQFALRLAENCYANWSNILTSAAITGGLEM